MRNRRLLYSENILYPLETNVQTSQIQAWVYILDYENTNFTSHLFLKGLKENGCLWPWMRER